MKKNKVHFIGIGGIGVSALARYYLASGWQVSGSDLARSEITGALKKAGARIKIGKHKADNLSWGVDLVVFSPAVKPNNPELKQAYKLKTKNKKLKIWSYPEALGELTRKYFTIAVSGTHGKSTTTAMIGLILIKASLDPTVIVGTKLKEFSPELVEGSNCRVGKSKYLVIEADEHFASFLNYWPKIIVLTTIEREHLDYYKNLNNVLKTYKKYISHLPKDGVLVANNDDKNISKIKSQKSKLPRRRNFVSLRGKQFKIKNYSIKQKEAGKIKKILKIPGRHNMANALAALTVGRQLGISDKVIFKSLSEYKGAWRRFEEKTIKLKTPEGLRRDVGANGAGINYKLISDYGHHPTEIKVTCQAAREKYPKRKIWLVFQPHQYQRTYYLFNDFVKVLRQTQDEFFIDKLILTDVYDVAGREDKGIKKKINSEKLVKAVGKPATIYLPKENIVGYLKRNLKGGEVVIIMGAGDIYELVAKLEKTR